MRADGQNALFRPKRRLGGISPTAWEHPADRVALQTLRAIPGFDEVVRRVVGALGERGVRLLFQANAVRVGKTQHRRLDTLYAEVLGALDIEERPELFVSQAPFVNAGAYGLDRPFIVLHSGTLELLDDEETAFVLGHELGHVASGHALYHTLLVLVLDVGLGAFPALGALARLPLQLTLLEWYRKSELSCDRAGLLAVQNPTAALRTFLKLAGGAQSELDLEAFLAQAHEVETETGIVDRVFKILNAAGASHPFHTLRAAELDRWVKGGHYDRILAGGFPQRGQDAPGRTFAGDVGEASDHYAEAVRSVARDVVASARSAVDLGRGAVRSIQGALRRRN